MIQLRLCLVLLLIYYSTTAVSQGGIPYHYWTFNSTNTGQDSISGKMLDAKYYNCQYSLVRTRVGKGLSLGNSTCPVITSALGGRVATEFSIEVLFKGEMLTFLTFPKQTTVVRFDYGGFLFRTTSVLNGRSVVDDLHVELRGSGRRSYNYYTDGEWHHLVFTASLKSGKKEIWVDGECLEGFSGDLGKANSFEFGASDGFRNTDKIDELAFYNSVLSPELIKQHYAEVRGGSPYSFKLNRKLLQAGITPENKEETIDPAEFAPGYPDYTIQAVDQLKAFPDPRFHAAVPLRRNMSWMDISYLHRELPARGGKGFGKADPNRAVALTAQMAEKWNYYIDIPVLRMDSAATDKVYGDHKSVEGALIEFAKENPQYPVASILFEPQVRPVHAGFESRVPYVSSQKLPDKYYFRDARGNVVQYNRKKWISPLAPLDIIQKDGKTSRFYLAQLLKYLRTPPALINENGEVFGHMRKEDLLRKDPAVWAHYKSSGMTPAEYSGWFQYRMDSTYRTEVMNGLDSKRTHFSFYNLSAINPEYWPDYASRRELNRWSGDTMYSTPDFYPRTPDNWRDGKGSSNGYGRLAHGRAREIELGDKFFSPFVAAGWGREEDNIRPAQWLALLKSLVMLGADFFYTGYFNVTGAGGKWPNGVGPNDPRGYAYQIAIPSYAQAIRSWVPEFFEKGELLNPADPRDLVRQFRFRGLGENELILVRKSGKKYLIYGSVQPNSNIKGNVPQEKKTTIELDGRQVSFVIRRQGSMYVLDLSELQPVFYQVDGWHQYQHPYYWGRDLGIEGEAFIRNANLYTIYKSTANHSGLDFSEFTSFARLDGKYSIPVCASWFRRQGHFMSAKIKARTFKPSTRVLVNGRQVKKIDTVSEDWSWYVVDIDKATSPNVLSIEVTGGYFDVDKFIFYERR